MVSNSHRRALLLLGRPSEKIVAGRTTGRFQAQLALGRHCGNVHRLDQNRQIQLLSQCADEFRIIPRLLTAYAVLQMSHNEFCIQLTCPNQLQKRQQQTHGIRPAGNTHQHPLRRPQQVLIPDISLDFLNHRMHGLISLDALIRHYPMLACRSSFAWPIRQPLVTIYRFSPKLQPKRDGFYDSILRLFQRGQW